MGILDRLTGWFRSEAEDVRDAIERVEQDLDADLTRKERELTATPEEKMASIQGETSSDDLLAEVQAKIDAKQAKAEAVEEVSGTASDETASDETALDEGGLDGDSTGTTGSDEPPGSD